eukprot:4483958-Pyramimonas_sp.AAC.1
MLLSRAALALRPTRASTSRPRLVLPVQHYLWDRSAEPSSGTEPCVRASSVVNANPQAKLSKPPTPPPFTQTDG